VTSLRKGNELNLSAIFQNRKLISRYSTHPQSWNLIQIFWIITK